MDMEVKLFEENSPHVQELVNIEHTPLISSATDRICLMGSCFSWHLHDDALRGLGLNCSFQWPSGFHFSNESLADLLEKVASGEKHTEADLYTYSDDIGGIRPINYYFNYRFAHDEQEQLLSQLDDLANKCAWSLKMCTHLVVVTGTPRVVRLKRNDKCVSVTVKMPTEDYYHYRNSPEDEVAHLERCMNSIRKIRGGSLPVIIFMLSPLYYMFHPLLNDRGEDGTASIDKSVSPFVEDNLGKAIMRVALNDFMEKHAEEKIHYFPAYEIVVNELRSHEPFRGKMASIPHFPYTPQYVVKRFVQSYVNRDIVTQMELAEEVKALMSEAESSRVPLQISHLLMAFVERILPRIEAAQHERLFNSALLRHVFVFLAKCSLHDRETAREVFARICSRFEEGVTIAIWAVGGNYQAFFSKGVQNLKNPHLRFRLVDSDSAKWGSVVDEHAVESPDSLAAQQPEYIFIASYYHDEILAVIRSLAIESSVA